MKNDGMKFEKVYQVLKNKIICGLLSDGEKLPSRANLCREFHTSEKTIRRAVEMLAQDGLLETAKRKRPTVAFLKTDVSEEVSLPLEKSDATAADDIFKTGSLLCYPINRRGMFLCSGEEWKIPESIIGKMDPNLPEEFWRLLNRFWRFFIARNENELILRAVDSLGFGEVIPLPGTYQTRLTYHAELRELIQTMKCGGELESVHIESLYVLYGISGKQTLKVPMYQLASPLKIEPRELKKRLCSAQERYSNVYLDLLGMIAVGWYQPGERLPSHQKLCSTYGVSIDTTLKAVRILQDWGVVNAVRGKGTFVTMDLKSLKRIDIEPELIACQVRRYLDSLELLSLTVEGVAAHAAVHIVEEEVFQLYEDMDYLWNEDYLYQFSSRMLLDFLAEHIQYDALRTIYRVIQENYRIGRNIPKMVNRTKTPESCAIHKSCMEAAKALAEGNKGEFARRSAEVFQDVHQKVLMECKQLGYWEAAMKIYDGQMLWK